MTEEELAALRYGQLVWLNRKYRDNTPMPSQHFTQPNGVEFHLTDKPGWFIRWEGDYAIIHWLGQHTWERKIHKSHIALERWWK